MPPLVLLIEVAVTALLVEVGVTAAVGATIGAFVGTVAVTAGLSLATSYIQAALAPDAPGAPEAPAPSDGQQITRNPITTRWKFYGRVKLGGAMNFYESKDGTLYIGMMHNHGALTEIEEHWLNDFQVSLMTTSGIGFEPWITSNGASGVAPTYLANPTSPQSGYVVGYVADSKYFYQHSRIRIINHMGDIDQVADDTLRTVFSEAWTVQHKLQGIAWTLMCLEGVPSAQFSNIYRGGVPSYRVVARASKIYDSRSGVTAWSDNAALVILDYLTSDDGLRLPMSRINMDSINYAVNKCAEVLSTSSGVSEARYRIWGGYKLDEQPVDVLARMLVACGGDLYLDNRGRISLRVAEWVDPTVTIDADAGHVIAFDLKRGVDAFTKFNEVKIVFMYPENDYQETDCSPWVDHARQDADGEVLEDKLDLYMVPSYTQARRLAKIHYYKSNPAWVGTIMTNLYGLTAINERSITLNIPELGINSLPFYVLSIKLPDSGGAISMEVAYAEKSGYDFTYDDEGPPPVIELRPNGQTDTGIPKPSNVSLVSGPTNIYVVWDEIASDTIYTELQYRVSGISAWNVVTVPINTNFYNITSLTGGDAYDVIIKYVGAGRLKSSTTPTATKTVATGADVLVEPTTISISHAGNTREVSGFTNNVITSTWTTPNIDTFVGVKLYYNTANTVSTASLLDTIYQRPNLLRTHKTEFPTLMTYGTHYFWVASFDAIGTIMALNGPYTVDIIE